QPPLGLTHVRQLPRPRQRPHSRSVRTGLRTLRRKRHQRLRSETHFARRRTALRSFPEFLSTVHAPEPVDHAHRRRWTQKSRRRTKRIQRPPCLARILGTDGKKSRPTGRRRYRRSEIARETSRGQAEQPPADQNRQRLFDLLRRRILLGPRRTIHFGR